MKCPGSTMVPNDAPRGVTEFGNECCDKIRKLLGPAPRSVGRNWHDAIDPREAGADEEEDA